RMNGSAALAPARLIALGSAALTEGFALVGFETYPDPTPKAIEDLMQELQRNHEAALIVIEQSLARNPGRKRTRRQTVLFPVRIDDTVMQTSEAWTRLLRLQRNIGDFTRWNDHDGYRKSFERVLH